MPRRARHWKSRGKLASETHAKKAIPIDYTTPDALKLSAKQFW
jgi:hypothetical protein